MTKLSLMKEILRRIFRNEFTFTADGLYTIHDNSFMNDNEFIAAWNKGKNSGHSFGDIDIRWRAHVACWAAQHAVKLNGDFAECGVNTGILSLTAMNMIKFETMRDRKWWLLDTYCGLVDRDGDKNIEEINSNYPDCYEIAKNNFSPYPNAILVRGTVPETLPLVTSDKIAYLSIDMNDVSPEIAAGEYFWDKLVDGAVVLLDDYGWPGHNPQLVGWNEFAKKNDRTILSLPTGQGIIIK